MIYDDYRLVDITANAYCVLRTSVLSTVLFCSILFYAFPQICAFSMSRLHSSGLRLFAPKDTNSISLRPFKSPRVLAHRLFSKGEIFLRFVGRPMLQRSERCRNGAANGNSDACSDWPRAAGCAWPRTVVNKGRTLLVSGKMDAKRMRNVCT